jgi:hypothetical protein
VTNYAYNDFISQTDAAELQARLGPLECAIFERMLELADSPNGQNERLAIDRASKKILEIKVEKLGFPPITKTESPRAAA